MQMNLFGAKIEKKPVEVPILKLSEKVQPIVSNDTILEQKRKEFEEEMKQAAEIKPMVIPQVKPEVKEKAVEFFLNDLRISGSLWDMRCWIADHDIEEVRAWVQDPNRCVSNNYNMINVNTLLARGVDIEIIVKAIMENDRVTWKKRVCKCFHDSNACPRYRDAESPKYVMANCQSCRDVL